MTAAAGVGDARWVASAAFADYDGDGYVDLYVTNYVDFTIATDKICGRIGLAPEVYCRPDEYDGVRWPAGGRTAFAELPAGRIYTIREPDAPVAGRLAGGGRAELQRACR